MKLPRELAANKSATYRLQPRYYLLTTCVGFAGVAVGFGLLFVSFSYLYTAVLGVPVTRSVPFNATAGWLLLAFMVGIPVFIYIGCVLVAGLFGLFLVVRGKCSWSEALYYALFSRYPADWYKARDGA
jgi:hypothetical protein